MRLDGQSPQRQSFQFMKQPLSDTSPHAQRMHYPLMRRIPAARRLALAFELTEAGRKLILANLESRFPHASPGEIRRRSIARVLPRADVIRAFGFDPRDEDS
jgi:hypothetical protein